MQCERLQPLIPTEYVSEDQWLNSWLAWMAHCTDPKLST